ncbi:MAG TPA: hypothetical protein VFH61_17235 [Thermoleophilia bacterium]|nr:hypothetical protein [Thermoleophilia bacterium]
MSKRRGKQERDEHPWTMGDRVVVRAVAGVPDLGKGTVTATDWYVTNGRRGRPYCHVVLDGEKRTRQFACFRLEPLGVIDALGEVI